MSFGFLTGLLSVSGLMRDAIEGDAEARCAGGVAAGGVEVPSYGLFIMVLGIFLFREPLPGAELGGAVTREIGFEEILLAVGCSSSELISMTSRRAWMESIFAGLGRLAELHEFLLFFFDDDQEL